MKKNRLLSLSMALVLVMAQVFSAAAPALAYWGGTDATSITSVLAQDDAPETALFSIDDVAQAEGEDGTVVFEFTVSRSVTTGEGRVDWATAADAALAESDYVPGSGTLVFADGESSQTIAVEVLGDAEVEEDETFYVELSNPVDAELGKAQGVGTILNDDASPEAATALFSIDDVAQAEGEDGTAVFEFAVSRSVTTGEGRVDWATADDAALAESDYVPGSGTLVFADGESSQTIAVEVLGDAEVEEDETFYVELSNPVDAELGKAQGVGTILNDDADAPGEATAPPAEVGTQVQDMDIELAAAGDQVVTNTNDSGAGSLRQALVDVGSGGTITFSLSYPATITLTSGELAITKDMTITGPGADQLAISGNDASRVFNVNSGTSTISGITIRDGYVASLKAKAAAYILILALH